MLAFRKISLSNNRRQFSPLASSLHTQRATETRECICLRPTLFSSDCHFFDFWLFSAIVSWQRPSRLRITLLRPVELTAISGHQNRDDGIVLHIKHNIRNLHRCQPFNTFSYFLTDISKTTRYHLKPFRINIFSSKANSLHN